MIIIDKKNIILNFSPFRTLKDLFVLFIYLFIYLFHFNCSFLIVIYNYLNYMYYANNVLMTKSNSVRIVQVGLIY